MFSKAKIDKCGSALSKPSLLSLEEEIIANDVFDWHRERHLKPLTDTTKELQIWLSNFGSAYYIAQRLKRKPQIIRKLNRLHCRLTQLQDIGGCRIIVNKNNDVDRLFDYIKEKSSVTSNFRIIKSTDYRQRGRDDSGYRAMHLILEISPVNIELQIRSKIQHYWAESIERTSIIYNRHLKEGDGDHEVIDYFKTLSDAFYQIEAGRELSPRNKIDLEIKRDVCRKIITNSDKNRILNSHVNESIIRQMMEKQKSSNDKINNWIIVFDWNTGDFVTWAQIEGNSSDASKLYSHYESQFSATEGYEVVLVGSSDVGTIRKTHSHYFGLSDTDQSIYGIESNLIELSRDSDIDIGSRQIINTLHRRHIWGTKSISIDTLKNHMCKNVITFQSSLDSLIEKKIIIVVGNSISLNIRKKQTIEGLL